MTGRDGSAAAGAATRYRMPVRSPACRSIFRCLPLLLLPPSPSCALVSVELDPAWPAWGATIAATMVPAGALRTVPDGSGGLLLAWQEARMTDPASCNCRNTDDLYVQRLDGAGRKLWSRTDVAVCTWRGLWGGAEVLAAFEPTPDGGALVAWWHADGPTGTFGQRLGADGALRWGPEGATVFDRLVGFKWTGRSAADGAGGLWIGLDGTAEANVHVARCAPGPAGFTCTSPFVVPLAGTPQTVILLPGDRPGRALVVAGTGLPGDRSRIDATPVDSDAGGRLRLRPAAAVGTSRVARVTLVAIPDGRGGALLAWNAPSGTGFDLALGAIDERGRTRWTRNAGRIANGLAPVSLTAGAGGALAVWPPAPGEALVAESFDRRGRVLQRRRLGRAARAERFAGAADAPGGPLIAWIEWDGGESETLRAARLAPAAAASATEAVEGLPLLRREGRLTLERVLVSAPGRGVVIVHDGGSRALRAFGLLLR